MFFVIITSYDVIKSLLITLHDVICLIIVAAAELHVHFELIYN